MMFEDIKLNYSKQKLISLMKEKYCDSKCTFLIRDPQRSSVFVYCPIYGACHNRLKISLRDAAIKKYVSLFGEESLFEEML